MKKQPLSDWHGKMISRYQMLQLLGCGGMSEVWLATDTRLRRQVALKIFPPVFASEQTFLRDFAYEARAAATLEHPHILEIHDFGEQEIGQGEVVPYLVMPYVPGGTLRGRITATQGPLPVQESLHYLYQAAQAIDYAHSKDIIHRDIKPANMLLREDWLLLTDFGIAKMLNTGIARNQTYAGSGTPEYMAPEQITGQAVPASDRYSLAVVAYQLFTGHEPFHGATPSETIALHLKGNLPSPRQLNPQIPPEVEDLLLLALSRQPEKRPPSCMVLVNALQQAWMRGVQVGQVDPEATLLAPWSKRISRDLSSPVPPAPSRELLTPSHQSASSSMLPLAQPGNPPVLPTPGPVGVNSHLPTATTGGFSTVNDPFATYMGQSGHFPLTLTSPIATSPLEKKMGRRSILLGGAIVAGAVIGGGIFALEKLHGQTRTGPVVPATVPGPQELIPGVPVLALTAHTDEVWVANWDSSGRYLVTAAKDRYIMLWDIPLALKAITASRTISTPIRRWTVANIQFANLTNSVCWTTDGKKLVVGNDFTDKIYVLDPFSQSSTPTVYNDAGTGANNGNTPIYVGVIAGPDQNHFSVTNGSEVQVWNLARTDQHENSYEASEDLGAMAWSPDGKILVALSNAFGASTFQLFLWQATNRTAPQSWNLPQRDLQITQTRLADTLAWSPTDPNLLLVSDADIAFIWDIRQQKPVLRLGAPPQNVAANPAISTLSWSPNGRYVAASYDALGLGEALRPLPNPPIFIWDVHALLQEVTADNATTVQPPTMTFASQNTLQHTKSITDLHWSPDGRYLVTASLDKTVIIWKVDRN